MKNLTAALKQQSIVKWEGIIRALRRGENGAKPELLSIGGYCGFCFAAERDKKWELSAQIAACNNCDLKNTMITGNRIKTEAGCSNESHFSRVDSAIDRGDLHAAELHAKALLRAINKAEIDEEVTG